jgi:CheY-like chemotaxis protein
MVPNITLPNLEWIEAEPGTAHCDLSVNVLTSAHYHHGYSTAGDRSMGETRRRSRAQPRPTRYASDSRLRVLLVEDYEPFLRLLSSLLSKKPEIQIVGHVSDGAEAVRKAEDLRPDLIVLDIGLPSLNGIDAARLIRDLSPNSKILFLSTESSEDIIQEALSLGACAYVHKSRIGNELLPALDTVISAKRPATDL